MVKTLASPHHEGSAFDFSDSGWLAPYGPGAKLVCQIPGQWDDPALCGQWTVPLTHLAEQFGNCGD